MRAPVNEDSPESLDRELMRGCVKLPTDTVKELLLSPHCLRCAVAQSSYFIATDFSVPDLCCRHPRIAVVAQSSPVCSSAQDLSQSPLLREQRTRGECARACDWLWHFL